VERRYAIPFIVVSQLLFAAGAGFSFFLLPRALGFLLGFAGEGILPLLDANQYITFILHTMVAFGVAFEFPLILIMLALMDVVHSGALRRYRRHALFATFVAAAIITPTQDPVTMTLMAAPLAVFYEVSIVAAALIERRRARALMASST
jgi:sec-independent protein translocase protein TatC